MQVVTGFDLLFDSFFFPWLLFTVGILVAGRIVGAFVSFGTALILSFFLIIALPWVIFAVGQDLITILAIILLVVLVSRTLVRVSILGSVTLFIIAILVGGFLLQLLTGTSLAFR